MNLKSGKNEKDDIVLNLSVDFHERAINRNSRVNGEWGVKECDENLYERDDDSLNPIVSGRINWVQLRQVPS